jgi:hypothetical protein
MRSAGSPDPPTQHGERLLFQTLSTSKTISCAPPENFVIVEADGHCRDLSNVPPLESGVRLQRQNFARKTPAAAKIAGPSGCITHDESCRRRDHGMDWEDGAPSIPPTLSLEAKYHSEQTQKFNTVNGYRAATVSQFCGRAGSWRTSDMENSDSRLDAADDSLFLILDHAWAPTLGYLEGPSDYLREHKTLVDGTCHVLEWLGLVEADSTCAFGYRRTHRLERILVKRHAHPLKDSNKASASIEDTDVINSVFDAAVPDEDQLYVCPLARVLLRELGLIRYTQGMEEIPTRELRLLAAERREEDRRKRLLKSIESGEFPPKRVFRVIGLPT